MHPPSSKLPRQAQLVFPLLDLAAENGGRIASQDAYSELARRHHVDLEAREETVVLPCGQKHNLWERHVRFAKERAKHAGYLHSASPGVWALTEDGRQALAHARTGVVVRIIVDEQHKPVGAQIELSVGLPTIHTLHCGDARDLGWIADDSIPLVVTSVPYFDIKRYDSVTGQLSDVRDYDSFVTALGEAMRECFRVMMPGGRMCINVGNVLRSRAAHGTHEVLPLSADLTVNCRRIGFNVLTGIIWQKLSNCAYEEGRGGVLGQPGMPRMCIKSETEDILLFKKPGPNFHATPEMREASRISKENWSKWVRPLWNDIPGAKASANHPAPFPIELPRRLISMFSYTGPQPATVLDPFGGEFTTTIAAMRTGRSSIVNDISPRYVSTGIARVRHEAHQILHGSPA